MEFPKNKPLKKHVNRKELVHREVLEKYTDLKKRLVNLFEQTANKGMVNNREDLSSQKHGRDAKAMNMVSKEVVNQDAARNLENANENAHNQPKIPGERIRPVTAHCSTNPPPTQPLTTTTTFPTVTHPEAENPFRRSLILVEAQSKSEAKAKFHRTLFKGIEQQLGNLRAISSTCISALELCIDKIVELNNGIASLQQKGGQFGKYQLGRLDVHVNIEDNVSNIQAGFAQLRSLSILLNNSTRRIQRDGYGFVQLSNSSAELCLTEEQVRNDVSQVLTQLTQFRNRWEEQMDDIRQLILVSEFLIQDAIERHQDVKNLHKSLKELKVAETRLHNQCLQLNEFIRDICVDLRKQLGGEGYGVKDALYVNTASKFDMLDESVQQLETLMDELRNEVQNQFGEQKQALEHLAIEIGKLRKDFNGFTRNVTGMDGAVLQPDREVKTLQKIGLPKVLATNNKAEKLEKATSSERKPVGKDKSSSNEVQTTLGTRFSTAAASTSSKRELDLDLDSPDARPDPTPKRLTQHRLALPTLNAYSSSFESFESPSKNEYSSELFKEWRNGRV
ncbi:unnamed protein product [Orchesella dallaii]|uniref:Uncharacterized protein n=1 Tax=Orchesella dallaii TaxID=48710 RepID=A0ABP1RN21_9HEXA